MHTSGLYWKWRFLLTLYTPSVLYESYQILWNMHNHYKKKSYLWQFATMLWLMNIVCFCCEILGEKNKENEGNLHGFFSASKNAWWCSVVTTNGVGAYSMHLFPWTVAGPFEKAIRTAFTVSLHLYFSSFGKQEKQLDFFLCDIETKL